jgi:hypothetical protein
MIYTKNVPTMERVVRVIMGLALLGGTLVWFGPTLGGWTAGDEQQRSRNHEERSADRVTDFNRRSGRIGEIRIERIGRINSLMDNSEALSGRPSTDWAAVTSEFSPLGETT